MGSLNKMLLPALIIRYFIKGSGFENTNKLEEVSREWNFIVELDFAYFRFVIANPSLNVRDFTIV